MPKRKSKNGPSGINPIRIVLIVLFVIAVTAVIPFHGEGSQLFLANQIVNLGILYAILVGFLISLALERSSALDEHINLELNKLRRIYHIALNMARAEPRLVPWFRSLGGALKHNADFFRTHSFREYDKSLAHFRAVSYAIYGLPSLNIPYNSELYFQLLDAVADATEARQYIRVKNTSRIGRYQWAVMLTVTVTFSWVIVAATELTLSARLITAVVIFNLLLTLDLLRDYDRQSGKKDRSIRDLYASNLENVPTLEKLPLIEA